MSYLHFKCTIPAIPVAQPRQRHTRTGFNYTPKSHPVHAFKATARHAVSRFLNDAPSESPISIRVLFVMPRPKSKIWKTKPMPREPHAIKPDVDNLVKALKDALTGLVWRDDSQVYSVHATKFVASGDEMPRVEIEVSGTLVH